MQNKSIIINIVLAITLVVLAIRIASSTNTNTTTDAEKTTECDAVLNNIATRTSIRDYTTHVIESEKIERMLRAAMAAPTAMNRQPWHFIVIDQRNVLNTLAKALPHAKMLHKAPLAIVVCGDMNKAIDGEGRDFWIQDASAATENMLLAAHAMGLGAVWTGAYPSKERITSIGNALSLPANIIPLNVVVIGYPAENPQPKEKYKEENISYNSFDNKIKK